MPAWMRFLEAGSSWSCRRVMLPHPTDRCRWGELPVSICSTLPHHCPRARKPLDHQAFPNRWSTSVRRLTNFSFPLQNVPFVEPRPILFVKTDHDASLVSYCLCKTIEVWVITTRSFICLNVYKNPIDLYFPFLCQIFFLCSVADLKEAMLLTWGNK